MSDITLRNYTSNQILILMAIAVIIIGFGIASKFFLIQIESVTTLGISLIVFGCTLLICSNNVMYSENLMSELKSNTKKTDEKLDHILKLLDKSNEF